MNKYYKKIHADNKTNPRFSVEHVQSTSKMFYSNESVNPNHQAYSHRVENAYEDRRELK